nr:autophagy-related protein 18a-like [Aegilops tauschii subsp. strangulata]
MASTLSSSELADDGAVLVPAPDPLVHVAFNQHGTHFVAATATGFYVFSCHPLERVMRRLGSDGCTFNFNVTSAQLLTRSQLAVATRRPNDVSGAVDDHVIDFWNGMCKPKDARTNTVRSPCGAVGGFRLRGDHMLVAGEGTATLFDGVHWEKEVTTGPNPLGLCAMEEPNGPATLVYALPLPEAGSVQVRRRGRAGSVSVRAHGSGVACLALSRDGRLLATAGSRGTLLRIFSTADGTKLQELRRGIDRADIHCVAFSLESQWLAVSSDKGTVHVFPVASVNKATEGGGDDSDNMPVTPPAAAAAPATAKQGSSLSFLKGYLPSYFSSEWSLAQVRLREGVDYTVEFWRHHPNTILIAGTDGSFFVTAMVRACSFYRCRFDPVNAGEMKELEHERFIKKIKE